MSTQDKVYALSEVQERTSRAKGAWLVIRERKTGVPNVREELGCGEVQLWAWGIGEWGDWVRVLVLRLVLVF